jgi:4-amino-4-deoxychorismate lyase
MSGSGRWQDDRGLHYGDGLFETIRFSGTDAPLWEWHMQRLQLGCERLRLPAPDTAALARRARRLAGMHAEAVVKLIYSAGSGPRGYARPPSLRPRIVVLVSGFKPPAARPLRVRWCLTRLALQPALAAIKHLNRLEQVLARSEWCAVDIDEGLMLDIEGNVIAATAANLFVRHDGRWLTPPIDRCGIAGVARRWLIERVGAREQALTVAMVEAAEVGVLTNALHGPRQIGALAGRHWAADREVRSLRDAWRKLFAVAAEAG